MKRRIVMTVGFVGALLVSACSVESQTLGEGTGPASTATSTATGDPSSAPTDAPTPGPTASATGTSTPPTPPGKEPSDPTVAGIVAAHNAVRAAVIPAPATPIPTMNWSDEDAAIAKAYAAKCVFAHNPQRGQRGENIYASGGAGGKTPRDVVTSWASESKNYDYATNRCSGTCGHYTQVVWRESVKLGCAAQKCTTNSPFGGGAWELWVCDYSPPGNFGGRKPY